MRPTITEKVKCLSAMLNAKDQSGNGIYLSTHVRLFSSLSLVSFSFPLPALQLIYLHCKLRWNTDEGGWMYSFRSCGMKCQLELSVKRVLGYLCLCAVSSLHPLPRARFFHSSVSLLSLASSASALSLPFSQVSTQALHLDASL